MKRLTTRRSQRPRFHRRTEPGTPPGTLISDPAAPHPEVSVMAYDAEHFEEHQIEDLQEIPKLLERWPVTWVNVDGVGDAAIVRELGQIFGLHALALEDVIHVHQRAKAEAYPGYYFIVARMPVSEKQCESEQISFFLGAKFVLTFQQHPGGVCLNAVRTRIRSGWGRTNATQPDFLVYALLDTIVDHYFPLVEQCGEMLDELEELTADFALTNIMARAHTVKRSLLLIRRVVWPLRDAINSLFRDQSPLIHDETRIYMRDIHDHIVQIIDLVESYRDIASGVTEVYLSRVSLRMNEIMKVLTIIATIFIPLTFIVGIYGMNFDHTVSPWNMPEVKWYYGYPICLLVMALIAVGMLYYFRRKGWLGGGSSDDPPESSQE